MELETLKREMKDLLVSNLMLQVPADSIEDTQPLFGPEGLGLDSVDALQLVVALDKTYGLKIPDPGAAQEILRNVGTMAAAVAAQRSSSIPQVPESPLGDGDASEAA